MKSIYVLHDYTNEGAFRTMGLRVATIPEKVAVVLTIMAGMLERTKIAAMERLS